MSDNKLQLITTILILLFFGLFIFLSTTVDCKNMGWMPATSVPSRCIITK